MRFHVVVLISIVVIVILFDSYATAGKLVPIVENDKDEDKCGIYFAPSTIPGAGYGLFAAKSFKKNEYVTPGDLAVPVIELDWNNGNAKNIENLWTDYHWSARTFPGMKEEGEDVTGASFGIGAVPNCFHPQINLEVMTTKMDSAKLHRSRDPGAGAFTPYHNRRSYAWRNIRAGMELFVDYGARYFVTRQRTYGIVPTLEDYEQGDALVSRLLKVRDGSSSSSSTCNNTKTENGDDNNAACDEVALSKDMDEDSTSMTNSSSSSSSSHHQHPPLPASVQSTMLSLMQSLAGIWKSRTLKTLPENPAHLDYVFKYGTANLHYNRSMRSLKWLEENGLCMDHIRPGLSTIKQAGRGGFAARVLHEGDVVAGVPLVHLPDRDIYRIYDSMPGIKDGEADLVRNISAPVHWQLMLNYCFGHRHSSLLLCPYGVLTSAINHAPTKEEANVKIQWSTRGSRHLEWLEQPVNVWANNSHSGLAFEYIATKEIDKNEEILLWYGDEWAAAWENHVKDWVPPPGSEMYSTADELNKMVDLKIRTVAEGSYDPKEKHLYCREAYRLMAGLDPSKDGLTYHFCRVVDRYHTYNNDHGGGIRNDTRYTAEIYTEEFDDKGESEQILQEVLFDLPRDAFYFRDAYYSRDIHLRTAFRHDMRIPDEIMPEAWLNRLE